MSFSIKVPAKTLLIVIFLQLSFSLIHAGAEEIFTWKDSVEEAKKNHPDLISARSKISQSEASKNITQSSFFPQVSGGASGQTSKAPSASARTDSYSYGVSGRQLVFDGFKTYFDVEQAVRNIESSRYN